MTPFSRPIAIAGLVLLAVVAIALLTATFAPRPPISSNTPIAAAPNCSQYDTGIGNQIAAFNASQRPTWKPAGVTYAAGTYLDREAFSDIFYSPRLSTCLAVVMDETLLETATGTEVYEQSYLFNDAVTGKLVDWINVVQGGSPLYGIPSLSVEEEQLRSTSLTAIILGIP